MSEQDTQDLLEARALLAYFHLSTATIDGVLMRHGIEPPFQNGECVSGCAYKPRAFKDLQ